MSFQQPSGPQLTGKNAREPQPPDQPAKQIPFWRVVVSVIQASFGIQSNRNRERDFTQGNFVAFVIAALLFAGVFILIVAFLVSLGLPD